MSFHFSSRFFYAISGEKDEKIHDECSSNAETSFIRNSTVSMNSCEVIYSCGMMIKHFVGKETKAIQVISSDLNQLSKSMYIF